MEAEVKLGQRSRASPLPAWQAGPRQSHVWATVALTPSPTLSCWPGAEEAPGSLRADGDRVRREEGAAGCPRASAAVGRTELSSLVQKAN